MPELTIEQRYAISKARRYEENKLQGADEVYREVQLGVYDRSDDLLTFGTADVVGIYDRSVPRRARIVDYKFGRAELYPKALDRQGLGYALGVAQQFNCQVVEVFFYQPRTDAEWWQSYSNFPALRALLETILAHARQNPLQLNPSPRTCQYCEGRAICPEFRREVSQAAKERLPGPDPREWARVLELRAMLAPWAEQAGKKCRELLLSGKMSAPPGWELKRRNVRKVSDVQEAIERLEVWVEPAELLGACCRISIKELEQAFTLAMESKEGMAREDAARLLWMALAGLVNSEPQYYLSRKESYERTSEKGRSNDGPRALGERRDGTGSIAGAQSPTPGPVSE